MTIAHTSKMAYEGIKPELADRQSQVYEAFKELGSATCEMVADYLRLEMHVISGRITELKKFGLLKVVGVRPNKSGCSATVLAPCDINDHKLLDMAHDCE